MTTSPVPVTAGYLKTQRLYRQLLCQKQYTQLPYSVQAIYKFALTESTHIPQLKSVSWTAFTPTNTLMVKKPNVRQQLVLHFLFTWFHKQLLTVQWHSGAAQWWGNTAATELWFYTLRYNFLANLRIYPFVPTTAWAKLHPRQMAILPWTRLLESSDLPLPLEDYLNLEWADHYRLGFRLRCALPNSTLPRWYTKVFTLRSHHYPTVYDTKVLPVLQGLSLVPLKTPYFFDELATARFAMDTRKKRLLMIFKALLKMGRNRTLLTEYPVVYRLKEQLYDLVAVSEAAQFFQTRWYSYFK